MEQKYCKGNNKYIKSYDRNKSSKCIICEDKNNLYG